MGQNRFLMDILSVRSKKEKGIALTGAFCYLSSKGSGRDPSPGVIPPVGQALPTGFLKFASSFFQGSQYSLTKKYSFCS